MARNSVNYQRDNEHRLRVGVVGVGSHSYRNILPALHYLPVELVAVCDLSVDVARRTAAEYGASGVYASATEMYAREQLDAVLLCVGPKQHPYLTEEALAAGLHVWMEKPPAMRVAELESLLPRVGDRVVMTGFKKAFMPATTKVIELVASGEVGELVSVLADYPVAMPADGPEVLTSGEETDWLHNGCHPISLMIRVAGPVAALTAHRGTRGGLNLSLEFADGVMGTLHAGGWGGYAAASERYRLDGTSGAVAIENSVRVSLMRGIPFDYEHTSTFAPPGLDHGSTVWEAQNRLATLDNKALFLQGVVGELQYFCDCITESQRPAHGSLEFSIEVMRVYEGALLSQGQRVVLDQ